MTFLCPEFLILELMSKYKLLLLPQTNRHLQRCFVAMLLSASPLSLNSPCSCYHMNHASKLHLALKSKHGSRWQCPKATQTPTGLRYWDTNRELIIASAVRPTAGTSARISQMWNTNRELAVCTDATSLESASSVHLWGTAFTKLSHPLLDAHTNHEQLAWSCQVPAREDVCWSANVC